MRVSAPSGPSRWSCPTTSSSFARPQPVGERPRRVAVEPGRREQAWARRVAPALSSAQLDRHLLAAAHDGDAPQPGSAAGDALEVARLDDLGAVRPTAPGRRGWKPSRCADRALATSTITTPCDRRIEPQLVGERRRQVGDLGALERRTRDSMTISSRGGLRRRLERDRDRRLLAAAQQAELGGCRRAPWWRSGSRRHWGPRPPGRRSRRSGRRSCSPARAAGLWQ